MSLRLVHLSDPHFGTIKPSAMKALLVAMKLLKPEAIIISGDITQRARRKQFEEARIFTHTFEGIPVLIMPGNHDIPMYNIFARFFHPYSGFKQILKGRLNQELNLQQVRVLAFNSTRRLRAIQGEVDIPILEKRLKETRKEKVRIVVFHHPLDCPKRVDEKNLLTNRNEVIKNLSQYDVDLVLSGHIHDPYVCLSNHRYPHINRSIILAVAGTCLSTRTRADANNSFNLIDIQTEGADPKLTISRYDLVDEVFFEASSSQRFIKCSDKGWKAN